MSGMINSNVKQLHDEEIEPKTKSGMGMLLLNIVLMIAALVGFIYGIIFVQNGTSHVPGITLIIVSSLYLFFIGPLLFVGLKVLKPNEALVLTLFGRYYGTLKGEGFFFVNSLSLPSILSFVHIYRKIISRASAPLKMRRRQPIYAR